LYVGCKFYINPKTYIRFKITLVADLILWITEHHKEVSVMCHLSKREREVMNILLEGVVPSAAAKQLGLSSEKEIGVYKSRVRRKIFTAEQFLKDMKQYRKVLYKPREYKPQGA
jgi:DNA-binding NarL/FixJ family response regulator